VGEVETMYEIWIKKGNLEYKLDDSLNMDYELLVQMVTYLKESKEFQNYEIEIRKNPHMN
jgi:hypothetical protein